MNDWPTAQPLDTTHLHLEPLNVAHAQEMSHLLADTSLYQYTGGAPPTLQLLSERYIRQSLGHSSDGEQGWLNWIVRRQDTAEAIGFIQATVLGSHESLSAEIAWVIGSQHQGNGYATEASNRMVDWLHLQGVSTLIAHIHPMNQASAAVAHKLGLRATETIVDNEICWEASLPR
ncbi:MAG: GNAT family N-acetyltransferase [Bifidobacterium sp.]|jgi:RimJ/RimL family protein N-acetyltransferase|nr:GNAT family N-acetyltransferase [Bifidobacterium sp.]MCH4175684.1 GNAT family N-acetyltransferase [Bifidobacterium sp.]